MDHQDTAPSFEEAVAQLEDIVTAMETGSLSLEESLRQFERAIALSRHCTERLDTAEKRVLVLTADGGLQAALEFQDR
jgi:exodeoxyribonuclease VII small subunit